MNGMIIGFCINVFMWWLGMAATLCFGVWGFLASFVCMTIIMIIRLISWEKETAKLVAAFRAVYGFDPPKGSTAGTRTGSALGYVSGHHVGGVLVGALYDAVRHVNQTYTLTAEQYQIVNHIKGRQAWTPLYGFFMLSVGFVMTGGFVLMMANS